MLLRISTTVQMEIQVTTTSSMPLHQSTVRLITRGKATQHRFLQTKFFSPKRKRMLMYIDSPATLKLVEVTDSVDSSSVLHRRISVQEYKHLLIENLSLRRLSTERKLKPCSKQQQIMLGATMPPSNTLRRQLRRNPCRMLSSLKSLPSGISNCSSRTCTRQTRQVQCVITFDTQIMVSIP